jgi:hypothetical protein
MDDEELLIEEGPSCEILRALGRHSKGHELYPKEWVYDDRGQPTCTAFEEL